MDLEYCPELLAHFIAYDGELIYEEQLGEFEKFKQKALLSKIQLEQSKI
ncbi:MAG: hypothetical protein AAGA80_15355 [Cyanobacteria bacterium P01_F01_bin.143]